MADERDVEGPTRVEDTVERLIFGVDCTKVASASGAISNEAVKVIRLSDGADVTASVMTGLPSVADQIITWPVLHSLTQGEKYKVITSYKKDGQEVIDRAFIYCPKD